MQGGNASIHCRSGLQHQQGGWGNYGLTLMGSHRSFYYQQLRRSLADAGLCDREELQYCYSKLDCLSSMFCFGSLFDT